MKNVGISTGHCGFTDTFSNNIINDLQSSFTLLCFFMRRFSPIEYGIYIIGGGDMDKNHNKSRKYRYQTKII